MTESQEQKAIVKWFRQAYPQYANCLRISQSGGYRGSGRKGAIRTANMTAMGAVTGESDLALLLPRGEYGSLLIEHKAEGSNHSVTPEQVDYLAFHKSIGNCAVVTCGVDMAIAAIKAYVHNGTIWETDDVQH